MRNRDELTDVLLDEQHRKLAERYNDIACNFCDDGKWEKDAIRAFKVAIESRKKVSAKNDNDRNSLAIYTSNLGYAYFSANDLNQAIAEFQKSLDFTDEITDKNNEHYQKTLDECLKGMIACQKFFAKQHEERQKIKSCRNETTSTNPAVNGFSFWTNFNNAFNNLNDYVQEQSLSKQLVATAFEWGFSVKRMPGDGDCFFHSVKDQLVFHNIPYGKEITPQKLRDMTNEHIAKNMNWYEEFRLPNHHEDLYLENLDKQGTWPSHLAIVALSRTLNVSLVIISNTKEPPLVIRQANPTATLYLGWEKNNHFNSLHPVNDRIMSKIRRCIDEAAIDKFPQPEIVAPKPRKPIAHSIVFAAPRIVPPGKENQENPFAPYMMR